MAAFPVYGFPWHDGDGTRCLSYLEHVEVWVAVVKGHHEAQRNLRSRQATGMQQGRNRGATGSQQECKTIATQPACNVGRRGCN